MFESVLFCMATAVYWEARNQDFSGQLAVLKVVENRTHHPAFPNDPCDVITQGPLAGKWPIRNQCQFSFYCDGKSDEMVDSKAKHEAITVAVLQLSGIFPDNTNGAIFYHADYVTPWWARLMGYTTTIQNHIFYKDK